MASFSVEEVLEEVVYMQDDERECGSPESRSESESIEEQTEQLTDDTSERESLLEATIESCLAAFDNLELGDNLVLFKSHMQKYIKGSYSAFKPPSDPMKIILNAGFNCSSAFAVESKLWLRKISFRLTGKISIRNPYRAENHEEYASGTLSDLKESCAAHQKAGNCRPRSIRPK